MINEIEEETLRKQHLPVPAPPSLNYDALPWPSGDLIPNETTTPNQKLDAVLDEAFHEPGEDSLRRTRAVVVVYDGKIIAERYATGFSRNSKLIGWSMTKSLTNAIVGFLVKQGALDIHKPVSISDWKDDNRKHITLNDLLHASSGLSWEEDYGSPSKATNMLFKEKDMGIFAAKSPLEFPPGEVFEYSSGTTNLISYLIRRTLGDTAYYTLPYDSIFYRIGMKTLVIEPDAGGTFVGSSYSFATARDWARFGLLYLNDGVWNGQRILPKGWVKYTTTPTRGATLGQYGAQFWLNAGAPGNPADRTYPDAPADLYWADGYEGQNVFIIPSKKLVIVKLSLSHGGYLDDNMFLKKIIESL